MTKRLKTFESAKNKPNISFADLQTIVLAAGFRLVRTSGSHHIYTKPGVAEILNIQPNGKDAKIYQVRQVLEVIEKYKIEIK